jgi:hypothetical protein
MGKQQQEWEQTLEQLAEGLAQLGLDKIAARSAVGMSARNGCMVCGSKDSSGMRINIHTNPASCGYKILLLCEGCFWGYMLKKRNTLVAAKIALDGVDWTEDYEMLAGTKYYAGTD